MRNLSNVTLICADSVNPRRGVDALLASAEEIEFGAVKMLSHGWQSLSWGDVPTKVEFIESPPLNDKGEYSNFILKELIRFVSTDFAMVIQWDGYVWNPDAWTDEFLNYDYVGARWFWDNIVGNGGFSLRSKKLLTLTRAFNFGGSYHPEDASICRVFRDQFEGFGIKFAPPEIALKWGVENETYTGQFGWHGGAFPRGVAGMVPKVVGLK
jgi:hypothetical protein